MHKITTSLLTAVALFGLSACSSTDETNTDKSTTPATSTIKGSSTLAHATVCLDINVNGLCDNEDVMTLSDANGSYVLELKTPVEIPQQLIAQDGYNLILEQSNIERFRFVTQFDEADDIHNINTITSLLSELQREMSLKEAKVYLASKYNLDIETLLQDPISMIEEDSHNFLVVHGIELGYAQNQTAQKAPALHRTASATSTYVTPSSKQADTFLADGSYLNFDVGAYFVRIQKKIEDFVATVTNYFSNIFTDLCITDCPVQDKIERKVLTGIWGELDDANKSTCYEIDRQDRLVEYVDGNATNFNLYYSEIKSQLSLIKGWRTVKTFDIDVNRSDTNTLFTTTDNQEVTLKRFETLNACQVETTLIVIEGPNIHPEAPEFAGLSHLQGSVKITGDKAIKNLRVFYTRASDKKVLRIYGEDNGTFEFNAANDDENIWFKPISKTIALNIQVDVQNSSGEYSEVIYPLTLTEDQITSFSLDLGAIEFEVAEVSYCAVDAEDATLDFQYTAVIDNMDDSGHQSKETQLGVVLKDNKEHIIYVADDKKTDVQYFTADTDAIDLTQNCLEVQEQPDVEIPLNIYYSAENNDSSVMLTRLFIDNKPQIITESSMTVNNGLFAIMLRNNTNKAETMMGKTVRIELNGKEYTSILEHNMLQDSGMFMFMIVNANIIIMTNGYQENLTGI